MACAVAIENIKIIKEESLIEKSRDTSIYLQERMKEISEHPLVGEVRMKSFILLVVEEDKEDRVVVKL